jgi:hypothetical protein
MAGSDSRTLIQGGWQLKINQWLAMALACSFGTAANADELYEFFSIECMPELRTLRISSVAIWNIQEQIWPNAPIQDDRAMWLKANWALHEQALQRLERERNLYVFGQMYGMAQGDPIQCSLPGLHISIDSQKMERPDDEMKGVARGNPRIVASWANGKEAFSTHLAPGEDLQVSEGKNALTTLHCKPVDDDSPATQKKLHRCVDQLQLLKAD